MGLCLDLHSLTIFQLEHGMAGHETEESMTKKELRWLVGTGAEVVLLAIILVTVVYADTFAHIFKAFISR